MATTAQELGIHLTDAQIDEYLSLMSDSLAAYELLETLPDELPRVKYPRTPGYAPAAADNPCNAWYY
ncbi:MAG: hypothetical protein ACREPJ_09375, partial [Rhodanobacteraceae bacterium]